MRWLVWLLAGLGAVAGNGPQTPSAGYTRAADGRLVRIMGLPGALAVEYEEQAGEVDEVWFSGRLLMTRRGGRVRVTGADGELLSESESPAGPALAGFSREGSAAVACYADASDCRILEGGAWRSLDIDRRLFGGTVLAISIPDGNVISALVRAGELTLVGIRVSDGALESWTVLPGAMDTVLLLASGDAIYMRDGLFVARSPDGNERDIGLPPDVQVLRSAGPLWVEAVAGSGRRFLVRMGPRIQVSELPEVTP